MVQVGKDTYSFGSYSGLDRFVSYACQIREITEVKPATVLEIGCGEHVLGHYLKTNTSIQYTCADFAEDLKPDVLADVRALPFKDNSFDVTCAFEVLEHLPWEDFDKAVSELVRVAKKDIFISVPHFGPPIKFLLKIPFLPEMSFAWKVPFAKAHVFNGQHYWEIGKRDFPPSKIRAALEKHAPVVKEFVPFENQYHHFYCLKKKQ